MLKNDFVHKLIHFRLNLDYSYLENKEAQTNLLISSLYTNFIKLYKNDIQTYTVVYQYRDDLIGQIGLKILDNLSSLLGFKFYIYGKIKRYKSKDKKTKYEVISNRKLKKLNNILLIKPISFIDKVVFNEEISIKFIPKKNYYILENFTLEEIFIAKEFFDIEDYDDLENNSRVKELVEWEKNPILKPPKEFFNRYTINPVKLNLVWVEEDVDLAIAALQDVEQSDNINLYFTPKKKEVPILSDVGFSTAVKNKSNVPKKEFLNINKIYRNNLILINSIEWYGNWPAKERLDVLNYINGGSNESIYS